MSPWDTLLRALEESPKEQPQEPKAPAPVQSGEAKKVATKASKTSKS